MGNCQAVDAATLVIQHPGGKVEKLYSPITASQVMKTNPGHYVALLLSTTLYPAAANDRTTPASGGPVKLTRIKLLRPSDTLTLGRVYRLITNQEVMKGLWAKKQAKLNKTLESQAAASAQSSSTTTDHQKLVQKSERERKSISSGGGSMSSSILSGGGGGSGRRSSRTWQPSLNSILETAGSNSSSAI